MDGRRLKSSGKLPQVRLDFVDEDLLIAVAFRLSVPAPVAGLNVFSFFPGFSKQ
jgi:hypothetical protein